MAASYLHGAETIEIAGGSKPVKAAKTAVIGLIGTAPIHRVAAADRKVNSSVVCLSDVADAKYFGPDIAGYSIPAALAAIRAQGVGTVIVINVFDPTTNKTVVAAADLTITANKITLSHGDIISATVKVETGTGSALVEGTDYSIDLTAGVITVLAGGALDGDPKANVGFTHGNPSAILGSDIIGTTNVSGQRTGMQGFLDAKAKYGYSPKILIAPVYSTQATVAAALGVIAQQRKCRAVYIVDAPVGTMVSEAITGRGPTGDINFEISDDRGILAFPYLERAEDDLQPYSQYLAGVIAATDVDYGFWYSPSNKVIRGVIGLEIPISASLNDPNCEANALNEVGITTVFNAFGTGFRTWGNRSSAWPASSGQTNFIQSRRTADQIHESLEMAMLDYIDLPINDVLITAVLQSGNDYMRLLIGRGAVPKDSRVEFNAAKNPSSEIAAGHITFDIVFCPNPPAERITFESFIDINLLGA